MPTCEICGKSIQNRQALEVHKRYKHSSSYAESSPKAKEKPEKGVKGTKYRKLEIEEPEREFEIEEPQEEAEEPTTYRCAECRAEVTESQAECSNCGAELEWDA